MDDYLGDDSGFGNNRDGYDLHTVDIRDAWTSSLGHHIIFRIILNGEGATTLTPTLEADGSDQSDSFQGEGNSWTGPSTKSPTSTTWTTGRVLRWKAPSSAAPWA